MNKEELKMDILIALGFYLILGVFCGIVYIGLKIILWIMGM